MGSSSVTITTKLDGNIKQKRTSDFIVVFSVDGKINKQFS